MCSFMAPTDRDNIYIYGKHALKEALLSKPKAVKKVFLASHVQDQELALLLKKNNITPAVLSEQTIKRGSAEEASHQGVIALISTGAVMVPYDDFLKTLTTENGTALVVLDEIQDPHNVGAIIRSAAAFGIAGVLIPPHKQAPLTGAVIKVSAGMAFRVPLVAIGNVNTTLRDLKERGFWIYALAGEAEKSIGDEKFDAPAVFILGNESAGIREKTKETADILPHV